MALTIPLAGPVLIRVNPGNGLADLGYSANGVTVEEQDFTENVPGDERGGDAGPPIDIVQHGQIHIIQLELTKWDTAIMARVANRLSAASPVAGVITRTKLYLGDNMAMRLILVGPGYTRNYPLAIPRGPIRMAPVGSRPSRQTLSFECHEGDAGLMWNTSTA